MTHPAEPVSPNPSRSNNPTNRSAIMRVAIDTGPLYGHRSGVGVATQGMVDGLRSRADVELSPYVVSFRAAPAVDHRRLPLPGIVASHVWSRGGLPRADRWLGNVDVVHGTNYVLPPTRLPSVVTVYDTWFLEHSDLATPIVRRAGQNLRRAVRRGAIVHTTSHATAANVSRLLNTDRVHVTYLGLPPLPTSVSEDQRKRVIAELNLLDHEIIIAIGTEERRKDLPLLVDAYGRLDCGVATALVLVGSPGDASDAVSAAIDRLSPDRRSTVRRLGVVDGPTKSALLEAARVLAYPSLDEGFGFPILEAQMVGVPVVARAVGSIPEVGGDGVALVADRDADAFAAALDDTISHESVRRRLIEAGTSNLNRFSWDDASEQLMHIYRVAVEESL